MVSSATMRLRRGRIRPVWAGHPWVFRQAVDSIRGALNAGDEVQVLDTEGKFVGWALYDPGSALVARIHSRVEAEPWSEHWLTGRLRAAVARRARWGLPNVETTGFRAVYGEADDIPGLIVDRYGDALVVQLGTPGLRRRADAVRAALLEVMTPSAIIDRTEKTDHCIELKFAERGIQWALPPSVTQKTGYYFDLRSVRGRIETLARDRSVLDTFCFVGGMALSAARGGAARVVACDTSEPALAAGRACAAANHLDVTFEKSDAGERMRRGDRFDLVICDPPKLAPKKQNAQRAAKTMERLAEAAAQATTDYGLVLLCSCSAALGFDALERALALGARRVDKSALCVERFVQDVDHPVPAAFPEGLYLTGILAEISKRS